MKPRIAVRGLVLHENRLLIVNAWGGNKSDLWCAPGGGVETGQSLPDNLAREILEETGLTVAVDAPALVNEFHEPKRGFHQIEVFFRCRIVAGQLDDSWTDPEGVVNRRRLVTRTELEGMRFKPSSLADVAWGTDPVSYDPLEQIVY